jgi:histidinol-phosphate phosphatase family protein
LNGPPCPDVALRTEAATSDDDTRIERPRLKRWRTRILGVSSFRRSNTILFDRAGVLVNTSTGGGASDLELAPGAADALARARAGGLAVGVVASESTEQGLSSEDSARMNARVDELVGPIDVWVECTHGPGEECPCRKPAPGLIYLAAAALGTSPERCVVVGDAVADIEAAQAAGARSVLVPSGRTTAVEIEAAPVVAVDLAEAVELALGRAA